MGDAAAAAATYAADMAEMKALLADHGVDLPRERFDGTDAELFRFAATMGLLRARTPADRCARRVWAWIEIWHMGVTHEAAQEPSAASCSVCGDCGHSQCAHAHLVCMRRVAIRLVHQEQVCICMIPRASFSRAHIDACYSDAVFPRHALHMSRHGGHEAQHILRSRVVVPSF